MRVECAALHTTKHHWDVFPTMAFQQELSKKRQEGRKAKATERGTAGTRSGCMWVSFSIAQNCRKVRCPRGCGMKSGIAR